MSKARSQLRTTRGFRSFVVALSFDLIIMINSVCAYYGASLEPLLKGISRLLKLIEELIDAP